MKVKVSHMKIPNLITYTLTYDKKIMAKNTQTYESVRINSIKRDKLHRQGYIGGATLLQIPHQTATERTQYSNMLLR